MRGCSREGGVCGCSRGERAWLLLGGHAWLLVAMGGCAWLLLGGVHGCSRGGHAWFFPRGGVCRIRRDTVNERAVRILLECILVNIIVSETALVV